MNLIKVINSRNVYRFIILFFSAHFVLNLHFKRVIKVSLLLAIEIFSKDTFSKNPYKFDEQTSYFPSGTGLCEKLKTFLT